MCNNIDIKSVCKCFYNIKIFRYEYKNIYIYEKIDPAKYMEST